jgi:beta-lactamase regulating signal transducer with metallopeptidase domain
LDLVIEWGWRGLVLAVGVMTLADHWPRASAATRYQIGWVTLALVIGLPLVHLLPDTPAAAVDGSAATRANGLVSIESVPSFVVMAGLCVWALWTLVGIVRLVKALAALHRVRATCQPFPPALEARLTVWTRHRQRARASRLVLSEDVRGAAVFGLWPPLVALSPAVAARLTPAELDRIVVHELAHVARRDDWADLAQLVIRTFAGWHPAVWWLDRRLRAEREAACDDWVVALTGGAIPYAASLVKLAELQRAAARRLQLAPGVLGRSALTARVDRLLDRRQNRAICGSSPVVLVVAILAIGLGIQLSAIDLVATRTLASRALENVARERLLAHIDRQPDAAAPAIAPDARRPAPSSARSSLDRRRSRAIDDVPAGADREAIVRAPMVSGAPGHSSIMTATTEHGAIDAADPVAVTPLGSHVLTTLPVAPAPVSIAQRHDRPQTPWGAAADGGVAIGEGSRKAAVATAGFFTRFGKSIGGSF